MNFQWQASNDLLCWVAEQSFTEIMDTPECPQDKSPEMSKVITKQKQENFVDHIFS